MKISTHILPEHFPIFLETVKRAEQAGFARAWIQDSHMLWRDAYIYTALGLSATTRIQFGIAVGNPLTRHYTVTASAAATLADLYPGRVILGIGRGDSAVRTIGLRPVRTGMLDELVPRVRELLAGRTIDINGTEARIRWAADRGIPLLMAATGPRSLRLAGALADIVMMQVGVNPACVRWAIEQVQAGLEGAGRTSDSVEISLACALWVSDDLSEARRACRWSVAATANHLEDVVRNNPQHEMPAELIRVVEIRKKYYDYYGGHLDSAANHAGYATDDLIDDFAVAGSAESCIRRIRELEQLGVDEIAFGYLNGDFEQLERIGREIVASVCGVATEPQTARGVSSETTLPQAP